MTTKRYYATTPPPPPDESYWSAIMMQEEADIDASLYAEEDGWTDADAFRKMSLRDGSTYIGEPEDWQTAEAAFQQDTSLLFDIVGYNKGGLLVEWHSLRGFVPASQLVDDEVGSSPTKPDLNAYIGQQLHLRVIEINARLNRLILSERAAQVQPGTRAAVLHQLVPGDICQGIVTNICDFGVFIDLGGVEGLIHISELSWGRVEHPREIVNRGQSVEVYIIDIAPDAGRIALSLKRLQPDPWHNVNSRYQVNQTVEGLVTSVVDFGAFICLEEGLEGLIHVSELAEGHFLHPRNVVREGEQVQVRILNIDNRARRIGLSLRAPRA
ncbi:MAG: 30S ribosomal protein S1 [Anaerolineales bacterium]